MTGKAPEGEGTAWDLVQELHEAGPGLSRYWQSLEWGVDRLSQVRGPASDCVCICICHSGRARFQGYTGALQRSSRPAAGLPSHSRRDCLYQAGHWLPRQASLRQEEDSPGHSLYDTAAGQGWEPSPKLTWEPSADSRSEEAAGAAQSNLLHQDKSKLFRETQTLILNANRTT